ncbi:MAG: hypothetical protein QF462_13360, partial [Myxococcota bacterium]|nr:hypothetical protein [Myxococcota bacterium]
MSNQGNTRRTQISVVVEDAADDARIESGNIIAALCSFVLPGLGQLVQGRLLKGVIMFALSVVLWIFAL